MAAIAKGMELSVNSVVVSGFSFLPLVLSPFEDRATACAL